MTQHKFSLYYSYMGSGKPNTTGSYSNEQDKLVKAVEVMKRGDSSSEGGWWGGGEERIYTHF
jgi:hypothetical protein